jgi:hypothetical protein
VNYELLALVGIVIAVLALGTRHHRRGWPGRSGWQYHRVFSVGFAGLLLLIAGVIGWDLQHSRGVFQGSAWVEEPIWWQIRLGIALLLLAIFWARRVPYPAAPPRR